ncbi:ABC transporter ATP-binding protein [uncultured Propionibacterium sp.]|uniref:ABC transporter ATP-binding protein n=1 Tax=uncultured Propionibacterium sp. TaxID=218066 RepID=UPI00292E7F59|nr:ABC transporter ATP-binding protein [uncultured Propionibacterium sp.]
MSGAGGAASADVSVRGLAVELGGREILHGIDLDLRPGLVHGVIGPNGCGKTTLVRALCGAVPVRGRVLLGGEPVARMSSRRRGRAVAVVWQNAQAGPDVRVADMVGYGRYAHQNWFSTRDAGGRAAVDTALGRTGLTPLADRRIGTLSGGERQRVRLAAALAQEPRVLLLDEPTTHLDIAHQLEILDLVRELNAERGLTVVMVLHDLTHAARYCDNTVLMTDGRVRATGAPSEALSTEAIERIFEVDAWVGTDPASGQPVVAPRSRRAGSA